MKIEIADHRDSISSGGTPQKMVHHRTPFTLPQPWNQWHTREEGRTESGSICWSVDAHLDSGGLHRQQEDLELMLLLHTGAEARTIRTLGGGDRPEDLPHELMSEPQVECRRRTGSIPPHGNCSQLLLQLLQTGFSIRSDVPRCVDPRIDTDAQCEANHLEEEKKRKRMQSYSPDPLSSSSSSSSFSPSIPESSELPWSIALSSPLSL